MFYFIKRQCVILSRRSCQLWHSITSELKEKILSNSRHYHRWKNLTWKNHIEVAENKISKNLGVLYRAIHLLDFKKLLKIYLSFIHIYISYANIAWVSTFKTKLQGILKKRKYAARITFHATILDHARSLLKEMKSLNFN